ncbi:HAD family hydrolase [Yimella sp. cx-573]|nr:HAD family hydrolase [Yimella sp. cx-573]
MDGTLLTDDGALPDGFWTMLADMRSRGITFVPASGRQYATLARLFADSADDLAYVAENGNMVVVDGEPVATYSLDNDVVQQGIAAARAAADTRELGLVVCGVNSAYVERADALFLAEVEKYYARLAVVDDLTQVDDRVLKLAVFDFEGSQECFEQVFSAFADQQVVISGQHWLDIMRPDVDKGRAVRALQERLGVSPAQTAIFGDYLNDLQMMDAGDWSFAMDNAHPQIKEAARFVAPSNQDSGVVQVMQRFLDG